MGTESPTADTMLEDRQESALCRWKNIGKMSLDQGGNDSQPAFLPRHGSYKQITGYGADSIIITALHCVYRFIRYVTHLSSSFFDKIHPWISNHLQR